MKYLSNKNILIASIQPWHSPLISKHFVTLELAKLQNNIVFITLYRIIKDRFNYRYLKQFKFHDIEPARVNIREVCVPPGFLRNQILYWATTKLIRQALGYNYYPEIVISFDPQFYILNKIFPDALKIYFCVDYLVNNEIMAQAEDKMLSTSDLVITASRRIYDDLRMKHSNVNYIPHGVNLLEDYEDHPLKNRIDRWFEEQTNRPIFGFVGYVSININLALIEYIARKNPTSMIALIGLQAPDVAKKLAKLPSNVFWPGPVPSIGVKYCLDHFDVGIVPYIRSRYILRTNPIKILQYIASGLPVVTTEVGEDFTESNFVIYCANAEEFNQNLKIAFENNSTKLIQQRIRYGKENSWRKRAELLDQIIESFLH
ncbi:MAG: glycosyltransferase [bacterium]